MEQPLPAVSAQALLGVVSAEKVAFTHRVWILPVRFASLLDGRDNARAYAHAQHINVIVEQDRPAEVKKVVWCVLRGPGFRGSGFRRRSVFGLAPEGILP